MGGDKTFWGEGGTRKGGEVGTGGGGKVPTATQTFHLICNERYRYSVKCTERALLWTVAAISV